MFSKQKKKLAASKYSGVQKSETSKFLISCKKCFFLLQNLLLFNYVINIIIYTNIKKYILQIK